MTHEQPLKICLASRAPFMGGAEIAAERLALGLIALGHDVVVLLANDGALYQRLRKAGARCVVHPMRQTSKLKWPAYFWSRHKLMRFFQQEQPDIVHANDLPTHAMIADAAKRAKLPILCHHRFTYPQAALDWMNKFRADHHLFITHALRAELHANSPRLAQEPSSVVHDGIPIPDEPTELDQQSARIKLGLPENKAIVLFVGQVIECKGVADLLHAWSKLSPTVRDQAELVIVGEDYQTEGRYRESMEQRAASLKLSVRFVGFQSNVGDWQTAATLAVVPSHVEPFGLVSLEAMARAIPVVATHVGGIPEAVIDGQTGMLVSPSNPDQLAKAIESLLKNPERRIQYGHAGRQRCQTHFSIEAHVQAVVAQYRRQLNAMNSAQC